MTRQNAAAHALKGSTAVVGAMPLCELVATLEDHGKHGQVTAACLPRLTEVVAATAAAVRAWLAAV